MAKPSETRIQRKTALLVQSSLLREKLAVEMHSLVQVPDVVSKGLNVWSQLGRIGKKPLLAGALVLIFWLIRPRRIISLLFSATVLFNMWQRFKPILIPVISFLTRRGK